MKKEIEEALKYVKEEHKENESTEWSTREKLALASAVSETGEVYWPAISRLVQPFGEKFREKNWCTAKDCAKQYSQIIDSIEKKKRSDNSFASLNMKEQIVKRLTVERIQELQDALRVEQEKQNVLTSFLSQIESGSMDDEIDDIWESMKEDSDFCSYVMSFEKIAGDDYSETTDAMKLENKVEEHLDDVDFTKPRLVLHLKKTNEDEEDYDEDDNSTEPAIDSQEYEYFEIEPNPGWNKISKLIINNVLDDPNSHLFNSYALSKSDYTYSNSIKCKRNPTDIRNCLRDDAYSSPVQFQHDLLIVFLNALCFFPYNSPSNKIIRELYEKIHPLFQCLYGDGDFDVFTESPTRRRTTRNLITN